MKFVPLAGHRPDTPSIIMSQTDQIEFRSWHLGDVHARGLTSAFGPLSDIGLAAVAGDPWKQDLCSWQLRG
jgi:hypothetical protein